MNEEIKELCSKCEYHIHCQGKGCAFRSLGNEYCYEVENANNLINDLQQRIDKAIEYLKYSNPAHWGSENEIELLEILKGNTNDKTNKENN